MITTNIAPQNTESQKEPIIINKLGHSPLHGRLIKQWSYSNGIVSLFIQANQALSMRVSQSDKATHVSSEWISGIPKEVMKNSNQLSRFLTDTFIRVVNLDSGELKVYISPRLKGGIFGQILSVISSGIGFFTTSNYIKLAGKVGGEARSTIEVAGRTIDTTILRAEDSAKKTIDKMGREVRTSIQTAEASSKAVIKESGNEIQSVIATAGNEARLTSKIVELQIEKAMRKASEETEVILTKAGMEARRSIAFSSEEARNTWFAMTNDVRREIIESSGAVVNQTFSKCSEDVKGILDKAAKESLVLIDESGKVWARSNQAIIDRAFNDANETIKKALAAVDTHVKSISDHIAENAKGLILETKTAGRLLIKDTGKEIRVTADEILTKAFQGQEMIIRSAGQEARLTIQEAGKELRSTLYELPLIAGMVAEQVGRNFGHGLLNGLWGIKAVDEIVNKMKNLTGRKEGIYIQELLQYVYDQTQLSPPDKAKLYETLITIFNDPVIDKNIRDEIFLLIGVTTLDDKGLIDAGYVKTDDYQQTIIALIPSPTREILNSEGKKAIERYLPVPQPAPTPIPLFELNPLQEELDNQKLKTMSLQNKLHDEKRQAQLLLLDKESVLKKVTQDLLQAQTELGKVLKEKEKVDEQRAEAAKKIKGLNNEIEFLNGRLQNLKSNS